MTNILILEDEVRARSFLKNSLENIYVQTCTLFEAENVGEGLAIIQNHHPDIVFMDIELGHQTCFDLLDQLPEQPFEIIFTTAFGEGSGKGYIRRAFVFSDLPFLVKPISEEELRDAIEKYNQKQKEKNTKIRTQTLSHNLTQPLPKISISTTEGVFTMEMEEIVCCEADDNYTYFHLKDGIRKMASKTMKTYYEYLSDYQFIKIHASYLVNVHYIQAYLKEGKIRLKKGLSIASKKRGITSLLPVSKARKRIVKNHLINQGLYREK